MQGDGQVESRVSLKLGMGLLALSALLTAGDLWLPNHTLAEDDGLLYFPFLYRVFWDGWWNPLVSGGVPHFPNPQTGALYPPAWLLGLDYHAFLAPYLSLHFFIAGAGIFLLARRTLGSGLGPLAAGIFYGCGGAALSLATKLDKLPGYALTPWVLLGLTLALADASPKARGRGWVLASLAVTLMILGGSVEGLPTAGLAAGGYLLLGARGLRDGLRRGGAAILAFALGLAIAGILLVPFALYLPESNRGGALSAAAALRLSLHPSEWVGIIWPNAFWGADHRSLLREEGLAMVRFLYGRYGGVLFMTLAALGALRLTLKGPAPLQTSDTKEPALRAMGWRSLIMVGFFLFLSLGVYNPVYVWMQAHLPVFSSIRFPEKWWLGALPFLAFLVGIGLESALGFWARRYALVLALPLGAALGGVFAAQYWGGEGAMDGLISALSQGVAFLIPASLLVAGAALGRLPRALVGPLLLGIAALDLLVGVYGIFWTFDTDVAFAPSPVMKAIAADSAGEAPPPFIWDDTAHRGIPLPPAAPGLPTIRLAHDLAYENSGVSHGVAYLCGSLALRPQRQVAMLDAAMSAERGARRAILRQGGLRYWILWDMQEALGWVRDDGFRPVPGVPGAPLNDALLEDPTALPPLRWASQGRVVGEASLALEAMKTPLNDNGLVLVEGDPGLASLEGLTLRGGSPSALKWQQISGSEWEINYESDEDGVLILTQSWAPGWGYSIDDGAIDAAPRVNHSLVGAPAPKGKHQLKLSYRPAGLGWGALLSLLGVLGLGFLYQRASRPLPRILNASADTSLTP